MNKAKKPSTPEELLAVFGESGGGNYKVIDTIGVPHPFFIGPRHVAHASDHCCGRLGEETCREIPCAMKGCNLDYDQHETALLVWCNAPLSGEDGNATPELHAYLLASKDKAEAHNFAGFAFKESDSYAGTKE